MRVQNPDQYAATLLNIALPKDNYTPEKIRSMYGRSEVNINFPTPDPGEHHLSNGVRGRCGQA